MVIMAHNVRAEYFSAITPCYYTEIAQRIFKYSDIHSYNSSSYYGWKTEQFDI